MDDSRLKYNNLLTNSLKNSTLTTANTALKSSLLTQSYTSSLLKSKLEVNSINTKLALKNLSFSTKPNENEQKKKLDLNDLNSFSAKKAKTIDTSTKTLLINSSLSTNISSLSISGKLKLNSNLSSHSSLTSTLLNKPVLNPTLLVSNLTEAKHTTDSISNKRVHSEISSVKYENETEHTSFLQDEYLKTESLINIINNDYKNIEEEYLKIKRIKLSTKTAFMDNSLSLNNNQDKSIISKSALVNAVSASLLREPNFKKQNDPTREIIFKFAEVVIRTDPEFLLKLALYTRKELNIRVTANFLICLASFKEECRPFIHKYFKHSVVLPSDWIDIAEQYQLFMDKRINFGSLPSALRKSMAEKFPDFDKYQLAKYNKEKSRLAKNKELKNVKHVKSKLKDAQGNSTDIIEHKYIMPIKINTLDERILIDLDANENCKNLKFDLIHREEKNEKSIGFKKHIKGKPAISKQNEQNDQVACRINFDFENEKITLRHNLKEWTKPIDLKISKKNFKTGTLNFFIDFSYEKISFGLINSTKKNELGSYLNSKHGIAVTKLNCFRLSGAYIKLKDLKVISKAKVNTDVEMTGENEKELKQRSFTLKQLIRQLHISAPVDNVMCLLGKKYPLTFEDFIQSKLPGLFDSEKAGKRMKLDIPETWETQISLKGNKAEVWQQLIDNKKLPYMAMLRNLRNMIKTGISEKHHQWVIKKLQDEGAVIHSKQFPFRFFTAYEVLDELEEEYNKYIKWCETQGTSTDRNDKKKQKVQNGINYDLNILKRYKTALDNALKVATSFNVSPIKGNTAIFLNLSKNMNLQPGKSGKSLGKKITSISEIASLLALMFKYSCENSKLTIFLEGCSYSNLELEQGTILDNMKSLIEFKNTQNFQNEGYNFPRKSLMDILTNKEQYDNLIFLSNGISYVEFFKEFLRKYRVTINENLLFVNVNLAVDNVSLTQDSNFNHQNDINISGFSDAILRFVAERGNAGQLIHIENIDKAYELPALKQQKSNKDSEMSTQVAKLEKPRLKLYVPKQEFKTVKVFISSTFRDMHSERDILTRTVFPMLRSKLSSLLINIYEIDLRWGITESEANSNQTLDLCLNQVLNSDYFISMLGARYGHVLDSYSVRKNSDLDWIHNHPTGASITELEIETQLRKAEKSDKKYETTFFYFRNNSFINHVPGKYQDHFIDFNEENNRKLSELKTRLRSSRYEIFDGYPCKWFKIEEFENGYSRALITDLDLFAHRVFNNLFNSISRHYKNDISLLELDENTHLNNLTEAFVKVNSESFVGRVKLITKFEKLLSENRTNEKFVNIFLINGEAGSGKTSFLCNFINSYSFQIHNFVHCVSSYPGSEYLTSFLKRFCIKMNRFYSLQLDENELKESNDIEFYKKIFEIILNKLDILLSENEKFYIIIDGVDYMVDDNKNINQSFDWMPDKIPFKISFIFTSRSSSQVKNTLNKQTQNNAKVNKIKLDVIEIENLDLLDKSEFIKAQLNKFNKHLDENPFNNQMKLLTTKKDSANPLYLSLACEELRNHNQFETLNKKLKELPIKIEQLVDYVIQRLENDFGTKFTSAAFKFLCSSRDGLNEQELKFLLNLYLSIESLNLVDEINNSNSVFDLDRNLLTKLFSITTQNDLSTSKFLSFIDTISQTFLKPRSNNQFSLLKIKKNTYIENSLRKKYEPSLKTDSRLTIDLTNKIMALFYWNMIDSQFDKNWNSSNQRSSIYLPYHLIQAKLYQDLFYLLTDITFIGLKIELNLISDLMNDYDLHQSFDGSNILIKASKFIQTKKPIKESSSLTILNSKRFEDYKIFISSNFHLFSTRSSLFYQQAMNQPNTSFVYQDLQQLLKSGSKIQINNLFEWINKETETDKFNLLPTTIKDFDETVSTVSLSPNGTYVACGTRNCEIKLYLVNTACMIRKFQGHSGNINSLLFIGNEILCSSSSDGTASIWNVNGGYRLKVLDKHNGHVINDCCAEPNGKTLITVGWDCSAKIWNPQDGSLQGELTGHPRPINCVTFNPDGNLVVTGCWDSCIRIYNLFDRVRKGILRGHNSSVRSISFSNNGVYIASASIDGEVKLWNSKYGSQLATLKGHSMPVNSICFSPSNQFLVTGSSDRRVKIWTGNVGRMVRVINDTKKHPITCVNFFQKKGDIFAAGTHEGEIKLYETWGGLKSTLKAHKAFVKRIKFSENGKYLITSCDEGNVNIIDISKDGSMKIVAQLLGNTKSVNALGVNPQNVIVAGSEDCNLYIYPSVIDKLNEIFEDDEYEGEKNLLPIEQASTSILNGHSSPITAISFNSIGDKFASASKDALIIVWQFNFTIYEATELYRVNNSHSDWITDLEWSNSSDHFLTASNDFTLKIWKGKDGKQVSVLTGHTSNINSCSFKYGCVVSTSFDGSVKIWSHKGHEIATLNGHQGRVNSCDLHVKTKMKNSIKTNEPKEVNEEDGTEIEVAEWAQLVEKEAWESKHKQASLNKYNFEIESVHLLTCSDDSTIRLWKPIESDYLLSLENHNDRINSVHLNKNDLISTASSDKTVNLWNMKDFFKNFNSGLHLSGDRLVRNHFSEITAITFNKTANLMLTASLDGMILIWKLEYVNRAGKKFLNELKFIQELQAHESVCNGICITEESPDFMYFVTGSSDKTIKTWKLKNLQSNPTVELIQNMNGRQVDEVLFIEKIENDNQTYIVSVESASSKLRIKILMIKNGLLNYSDPGYIIPDFDYIIQQIKLIDDKLYLTVLQDKMYVLDLNVKIKKVLLISLSRINEENKKILKLFSSDINNLELYDKNQNSGGFDSIWYSSVYNNGLKTYSGDWKGNLYVTQDTNLIKLKQIHSSRITELISFKTNLNLDRFISSSQDGSIKVWSNDYEYQLGQFNTSSTITKLVKLPVSDENVFIFGDQMGNIKLIRWYD